MNDFILIMASLNYVDLRDRLDMKHETSRHATSFIIPKYSTPLSRSLRLRWSRGSVLAFGTQVREAVGFFRAKKSSARLPSEK